MSTTYFGTTRPSQALGQKLLGRQSRQSPALSEPLPDFIPPVGARGQDIMIIWDFQNVRTPTELEPVDVIRFLYNTFVVQPGPRRCAGAFCTFTDNTKKAVGEKRFNQFCSNGVLNFMMINSPGGPRKADDSDHPLKEMMMNFTVDCVRGHKDGVLLLITADADFVRPAIWCKQQGCVSLELLYYGPIASKEIRQLEANWKMEWRDFLDCSVGRRCAWTFPYPQDVAAGLVALSGSPENTSSYFASTSNTSQSSHRERDCELDKVRVQQQSQAVAGFLPAPKYRLLLPAPSGAGTTAAAAPAASAVQVSSAHVQQAAQQLLHNPSALHQVVQQYKQSMQTTAVLQQVLQGVAQAASITVTPGNVGIHGGTPSAATAVPEAAFAGSTAAGYSSCRSAAAFAAAQQQYGAASRNGLTSSRSTPVKLHKRPVSASSVHNQSPAALVGAAAGSQYMTWQQREQQQQGDATRGSSGRSLWDTPPSRSPPPVWHDSLQGPADGHAGSVAGGYIGADLYKCLEGYKGSSATARINDRAGPDKLSKTKHKGWAEEEDDGFWDVSANSSSQGDGVGSSSRSRTPMNGLSSAGRNSSSNQYGSPIGLSAAGFAPAAAAIAASVAAPPPPSLGLLKRAGGLTAGAANSSKALEGSLEDSTSKAPSTGSLAALLAGAAAKANGTTSRQDAASSAAISLGGSGQPSRHRQCSDRQRTPSPTMLSDDGSWWQQQLQQQRQQQQQQLYDCHMKHHEQQLALLRHQQAEQEAESTLQGSLQTSSSLDSNSRSSAAVLDSSTLKAQFESEACHHVFGVADEQPSTGVVSRPKQVAGPRLAAAARILSKATAKAAADAVGISSSSGAAGERGGASAVVLQAPPSPSWLLQQQGEQRQQQVSIAVNAAAQPVQSVPTALEAALQAATVTALADTYKSAAIQQQQQEQHEQEIDIIDDETDEVICFRPLAAAAVAASAQSEVTFALPEAVQPGVAISVAQAVVQNSAVAITKGDTHSSISEQQQQQLEDICQEQQHAQLPGSHLEQHGKTNAHAHKGADSSKTDSVATFSSQGLNSAAEGLNDPAAALTVSDALPHEPVHSAATALRPINCSCSSPKQLRSAGAGADALHPVGQVSSSRGSSVVQQFSNIMQNAGQLLQHHQLQQQVLKDQASRQRLLADVASKEGSSSSELIASEQPLLPAQQRQPPYGQLQGFTTVDTTSGTPASSVADSNEAADVDSVSAAAAIAAAALATSAEQLLAELPMQADLAAGSAYHGAHTSGHTAVEVLDSATESEGNACSEGEGSGCSGSESSALHSHMTPGYSDMPESDLVADLVRRVSRGLSLTQEAAISAASNASVESGVSLVLPVNQVGGLKLSGPALEPFQHCEGSQGGSEGSDISALQGESSKNKDAATAVAEVGFNITNIETDPAVVAGVQLATSPSYSNKRSQQQ